MPYADAFDQREPLGKPFLGSLALHGGVAALLAAGTFISGRTPERWGDKEPGGGTTTVVHPIPMMPRSGPVNRVANDTDSQVPQAPPQPKPAVREKAHEPDAIPLRNKTAPKKPSSVTASTQRYRPDTETKSNQLYGTTGQALVSPLMGQTGSGGVGLGTGSLGDRFGAYAALLRQLIGRNWKTQDVDSRIHTAPPVIMTFTILRDGTIRDIRLKTSSGNAALDRSAERAVYDVGKVDPLPAAYPRDKAEIEFWFELKR
jgi:TonB family protein